MSNVVNMVGTVNGDLELSHVTGNEKFYTFILNIERESNVIDEINVIISEKVMFGMDIKEGNRVKVRGQYRSFNKISEDGYRDTELFVFCTDISNTDDKDLNEVSIDGKVVKCFTCRTTRTGRKVVNYIVKVQREYGRYDYLTCMAWGRDAIYLDKIRNTICNAESTKVVKIKGRLQSRKYSKRYTERIVEKVVYELSVNDLVIEDNN